MSVLLLDTASDVLVAALVAPDGALLAGAEEREQRAQAVLALVDRVLADGGCSRDKLSAVGVGIGPGGFTGLRIGIATARGIAAGLGLPLAGLPTLAALVASGDVPPGERAWASLDARRGERFVQEYELDGQGVPAPVGPLHVVPAAEVGALVGDARVVAGVPAPAGLAVVASAAAFGDPMAVVPTYGREPDATPPRHAAGVRA